jgi:hypothetical protein
VVVFIVLGVLIAGGSGAIEAVATSNVVTSAEAANQVQTAFAPVNTAINNYPAKVKACNGSLSCVTSLDRSMADTLNTFAGQVRGIAMPSAETSTTAATLASSASDAASIFASLGAATSASQYQSIGNAQEANLRQSLSQMYTAYNDLGNQLTGS